MDPTLYVAIVIAAFVLFLFALALASEQVVLLIEARRERFSDSTERAIEQAIEVTR